MTQPMGSYDESLLRDAPVATRQQLQEGYTTDLLAAPSKPRSLNRSQSPLPDGATAAIPPTPLRADLEQGQRSQDGFHHYTPLSEKAIPSSNKPFFRTTKGIVLIVVIVIIIVGAVVGGAVGGTVNKSSSTSVTNSISTAQTSSSSTAINGLGSGQSGGQGSGNNTVTDAPGSGPSTTTSTRPTLFSTFPLQPRPSESGGFTVLQSESNAIAAMKQAGHHHRRDAYQASGNVDIP